MSITLKAFITHRALINNLENQIAEVGEISTYARTFSKDQQILTNPTYPNVEVLVFHSKKEDQEGTYTVHGSYKDLLVRMSDWLHETAKTSFNINTTAIDVAAAIKNEFNDYVGNIVVGAMVSTGNYFIPSKLELSLGMPSQEPMKAVLYTACSVFETEYDETDILIVPPFTNIDTLLAGPTEVRAALERVSQVEVFNRINSLIEKRPPTVVQPFEIDWIQPHPGTATFTTTWYAIVYGPQGISVDHINEATRRYILTKSSSGEAAWKAVMPDIFLITRFLIQPNWASMAMPGRGSKPTIYRPMQKLSEVQDLVRGYDLTELGLKEDQIEVVNHPYRSLPLIVLSGKDNKNGATSLSELYPDYIAAESTHEDYNRQAQNTILFSNLLYDLILSAEEFTIGKALKTGLRALEWGGKTCVSGKLKNIEYIMPCRIQRNDP